MFEVKQIKNIVNDAVKDALGKTVSATKLDATDIVSKGKLLGDGQNDESVSLYDKFFGSLVGRLAKTIYFIRTYDPSNRNILRDETEWGLFVQKVYYDMPTAVDNPTWNIPTVEGNTRTYNQVSPYDVQATVNVSALLYGGQGTWSIEIMRPIEQIKTAFLGEAEMASFIDGIYVVIENAYKVEEESLIALAANTAMASALKGGCSYNLLAEYKSLYPNSTLTEETCRFNKDFLRYCAMRIKLTKDNMKRMSTVFNKAGYETFTPEDRLVVEMLAPFASAFATYLESDTFHKELVALPNYEEIPYWQVSGDYSDFDTVSSIKIQHNDFGEGDASIVSQKGIICFMHDTENVAAYFGERYSWEQPNVRQRIVNHGEQARKGFAVDDHANAVVFYIADPVEVTALADDVEVYGKEVSELQTDVQVVDGAITGTLKYIAGGLADSGPLAGNGNFLALKFNNVDPNATSVMVGLDPSVSTGLVELLGDPDMSGVFKVSGSIGDVPQVFKVVSTIAGKQITQTYDLSGLTLLNA